MPWRALPCLNRCDVDGSGEVDYVEFVNALTAKSDSHFDVNQSGPERGGMKAMRKY